jgi:phytoene synthase
VTETLVRDATETIRKGSRSFAAASRLLDRRTREGAVLLYAWCRHCDDVVDGQALGYRIAGAGEGDAEARLAALESQTRAALDGKSAADPVFTGLQTVIARHGVPKSLPVEHLAGYRMDVDGRRYGTIADTLEYSYHVAGVVGLMMAYVMGVRDEPTLDCASDLGIAFQLTNIARDIVEDAQAGRVYLPADWLSQAGIPAEAVADPRHRAALAGVANRLLDEAEPYYLSARTGIDALPPRSAWAIATALGVYREIGNEVRRRGPRAWDGRVSTTTASKIGHVARGAFAPASRLLGMGVNRPRADLWRRPGP